MALGAQQARAEGKDGGTLWRFLLTVVDEGNGSTEEFNIRANATGTIILGQVLRLAIRRGVIHGADKRRRLADIARQRATTGNKPAQQRRDGLDGVVQVVVGVLGLALGDNASGAEMVLEVAADGVILLDNRDADALELLGRANTTQHQSLRGVDGAAGENDLALGMNLEAVTAALVHKLNTNGTRGLGGVDLVEQNPGDVGVAADVQVGALHHRGGEKGRGHGRALALGVNKGLEAGDAEGASGGVDIRDLGDAGLLARGDEALLDNGRDRRVARLPLAAPTAVLQVDLGPLGVGREVFNLLQVRREVVVAPALAALVVGPLVVVGLGAVVEHHGVDAGRAAEDLAAGPEQLAVRQARLLDRVVVPVVLRVEELGEEEWDARLQDARVRAARLEEEDRHLGVLGQLGGQNAAGAASADNDWFGC